MEANSPVAVQPVKIWSCTQRAFLLSSQSISTLLDTFRGKETTFVFTLQTTGFQISKSNFLTHYQAVYIRLIVTFVQQEGMFWIGFTQTPHLFSPDDAQTYSCGEPLLAMFIALSFVPSRIVIEVRVPRSRMLPCPLTQQRFLSKQRFNVPVEVCWYAVKLFWMVTLWWLPFIAATTTDDGHWSFFPKKSNNLLGDGKYTLTSFHQLQLNNNCLLRWYSLNQNCKNMQKEEDGCLLMTGTVLKEPKDFWTLFKECGFCTSNHEQNMMRNTLCLKAFILSSLTCRYNFLE